jgi:peptide chain release factor subunit 1
MDLEDRIGKLLEYKNDEHLITSLYLKLGPRDRGNFKYKTNLKNLIKSQRDNLGKRNISEAAFESVELDFNKIINHIDNADKLTECRGVCIFSTSKSNFWVVFKLPLVYRNQLSVDRSPILGQLIKINDDYRNIVTIILDRKKARIFRLELDGAHEILDFFYPGASRTKKHRSPEGKFRQKLSPRSGTGNLVQGYGEHGFHRTIENEIHQHYKYIADKVFAYFNENKFNLLVLGGTDKNIPEFSHHLHSYLRDRLAGTITVDVNKIKPYQLNEVTLDALELSKSDKEKRLLGEFEEKLGLRYAINGVKPTLKALMRGQVRILLVSEGFSSPGFICPESGILSLENKKDICPEGIEPVAVVDVVDDAMEEAFRQKAEIEILLDQKARKKIDGIGAILRFKL